MLLLFINMAILPEIGSRVGMFLRVGILERLLLEKSLFFLSCFFFLLFFLLFFLFFFFFLALLSSSSFFFPFFVVVSSLFFDFFFPNSYFSGKGNLIKKDTNVKGSFLLFSQISQKTFPFAMCPSLPLFPFLLFVFSLGYYWPLFHLTPKRGWGG